MSAEVFLDTNVLVYTFDRSDPEKAARATDVVQNRDWVISWQVIQEFSNVARHRFSVPLAPSDLADYIDLLLWPRCTVLPSARLYRRALDMQETTGYRYYDSLIVAAALVSGAETLLSEDLQEGRRFESLRIEDPFRAEPD